MTPEITVTRKEIRDELERFAQAKMGLSADAVIARYKAGALRADSLTGVQLEVLAKLASKSA
jgi:hypothetical protein